MGVWIASVTGIVALTLLVDIILPNGESNKYIKVALAALTSLTLIQPISLVLSGDFELYECFNVQEIYADDNVLGELDEIKHGYIEKVISNKLTDNGISGAVVDVCDIDGEIWVSVNAKNVVIADNQNHIFISKLIRNLLGELGFDESRITIYD